MATSSQAAAEGYRLFRERSGEISQEALNERLSESGFRPVSARMMSHYRALQAEGLSDYMTINAFDLMRKESRGRVKRLYLTATDGFDLRPVVDELRRRRYTVETSADVPTLAEVAHSTRAAVSKADAVVGIVAEETTRDSVVFDIGTALGLNKPAVLAVDWRIRSILRDRLGMARVDFGPDGYDPIVLAVERLRERRERSTRERRVPQARATVETSDFKSAYDPSDPRAFEALVASVISASGGDVHGSGNTAKDDGFDFAVWMAQLEPTIQNPLLVEVKTRLTGPPVLAFNQVKRYLELTGGSGSVLLVYGEGPPSEAVNTEAYPVIPIRFDELLTELDHQPFDRVIRSRRNRAVHSI